MNYQALGEYTAFKKQAKDAANNRGYLINNLMFDLRRARDDNPESIDTTRLHARINELEKSDNDMRDALARANNSGIECGQQALSVADLLRK